jgi:hypothetical protein
MKLAHEIAYERNQIGTLKLARCRIHGTYLGRRFFRILTNINQPRG